MIKGKKRSVEKVPSTLDDLPKSKNPKLNPEIKQKKTLPTGLPRKTKLNKLKPGAGADRNPKLGADLSVGSNNKFRKKPSDEKAAAAEKTDWNKFKKDKKDLKLKRKKAKDSYDVLIEAKKLYEKLKCKRTGNKSDLVEEMYALLTGGMIKKLVKAHDSARIIQCMLKFSTPSTRENISEELLPLVVEMSICKYSHFCVLRMFKYGSPKIKNKLVDSFFGNIVKLSCHNISSKIIDHAYLTVANLQQKINMRQEFYGDLYKNAKDEAVKQLLDTYKETPHMKSAILGSVKSNLDHVANKKLVDNSLVHAVMLEYLQECDEEKIEEVVTMYSTLLPLLLTTKEGCQAAIICFHQSTPKNRRAIIKTIKEHLVKICTHEHGYIFILVILNALDDTKAVKKAIYDTIHPHIETIMKNQWGRRVIEWFVSPGATKCFHPSFVSTIEESLKYGKKDKEVRRKEIFEQIEGPIVGSIVANPEFWISNRHIGLVTAEILNKVNTENFVNASNALAPIICKPTWMVTVVKEIKKKSEVKEEEISNFAGIEDPGLHIVLKKIIKQDAERQKHDPQNETFGSILVKNLSEESVKYWLTVNRACFILLNIVENNSADLCEMLKSLIKSHATILKNQKGDGVKLLLKKIEL